LIELGGLVAKAGLVELTDEDRAVIFGVLVEAAATLRGPDRDTSLVLWRRRGNRDFFADGRLATEPACPSVRQHQLSTSNRPNR